LIFFVGIPFFRYTHCGSETVCTKLKIGVPEGIYVFHDLAYLMEWSKGK
jgi:hypothetical protein